MPAALQAVLVVFTLAGIAGGAWGVLRANLSKATAQVYREDNDALRARLDTLERENSDQRAKIEELSGTLAALKEERAILRDLATGASAVNNLQEHLNDRLDRIESLVRRHTDDRRRGHGQEGPDHDGR